MATSFGKPGLPVKTLMTRFDGEKVLFMPFHFSMPIIQRLCYNIWIQMHLSNMLNNVDITSSQ